MLYKFASQNGAVQDAGVSYRLLRNNHRTCSLLNTILNNIIYYYYERTGSHNCCSFVNCESDHFEMLIKVDNINNG